MDLAIPDINGAIQSGVEGLTEFLGGGGESTTPAMPTPEDLDAAWQRDNPGPMDGSGMDPKLQKLVFGPHDNNLIDGVDLSQVLSGTINGATSISGTAQCATESPLSGALSGLSAVAGLPGAGLSSLFGSNPCFID
jgi:hypothetical protein